MARVTYYVTQPFYRDAASGRIYPGEAAEVISRSAAERALKALKTDAVGAVAFSRTGNPDDGDWDDAVVIGFSGEVIDQIERDSLPW